eukprot:2004012-Karenia_brevis.AAC.1
MHYVRLLRMISSTLMTWDGSSMSPELACHLDCFSYLKKPVEEYLSVAEKSDRDLRPERVRGNSKYLIDPARKWLQDELDLFEAWFHKDEWLHRWDRHKSITSCDCKPDTLFTAECAVCGLNKNPTELVDGKTYGTVRCLSCVLPPCSHCGDKTWALQAWREEDPKLLAYQKKPCCPTCANLRVCSTCQARKPRVDFRTELDRH